MPSTIDSVRSTSPPKSAWPGRVHDVDEAVVVVHGRVLGQNRDAALALELVRVHDPLGHPLVGPENAALVQQGVHQRRLAMVDVGDDGDVARERGWRSPVRAGSVRSIHQYTGLRIWVRMGEFVPDRASSSWYDCPSDSCRHTSKIAVAHSLGSSSAGMGLIGAGAGGPGRRRRPRRAPAATTCEWRGPRRSSTCHRTRRSRPSWPSGTPTAGTRRARKPSSIIDREGDGYRALSATCSHLGCRVSWNDATKQYHCPCHGGVYDRDGKVVSGPPPAPLHARERARQSADVRHRGRAVKRLASALADWLDNRTGFR